MAIRMQGLTDLGYKLFLDRYAAKLENSETAVGNIVLYRATTNGDREIGVVKSLDGTEAKVRPALEFSDTGIVYDDNEVSVPVAWLDTPTEVDPAHMWERVAQSIASVEEDPKRWTEVFKELLADWKFVPGGRILAGAVMKELSLYNCFVIPSPKDSKEEIFRSANIMSQLMSRGGGVGMNISTLRPRYAKTLSTNGRSSGAVSWGELYSYVTGLIEQSGCVAGDGIVATVDGNVPIQELVDTKPWIYTYDTELEQVTVKQANWVAKTGTDKEVWEVKTDKGLSLRLTSDHPMLCRDNVYRQVKDLKVGQSLMPLLRHRRANRKNEIYIRSVLGDSSTPKVFLNTLPVHRFCYEEYHDCELSSDFVVHHIDGNHSNNLPENLQLMTHKEHATLHAKQAIANGTYVLTDYVKSLSKSELQRRAKIGNDKVLEILNGQHGVDRQKYMQERIAHKFTTDNPMKTDEGKIANAKNQVLSWAYRLLNAGCALNSPEEWDKALYDNRITKSKKVYGLGIPNTIARSRKVMQLFGSFDNFVEEVSSGNHRIVSIEFVGCEDVYDMEVEGTHNFAVVSDKEDLASTGVFIHNSRRGALMLILDDWHPDILEFIEVKQNMSRIINANISIGISDKLMEKIENDEYWSFIFPDTAHPDYDRDWDGDIEAWIQTKGAGSFIIHSTIRARELWDKIIESAWACAEPGLWFKERSNKQSNSWYYNQLVSTNPCGEIPLAPWAVCCLGALNLSKFVDEGDKRVMYNELKNAIWSAVRFLDNTVDVTPYHFPENEAQQKGERKIGLGTLGLAEMLIQLDIRYGSDDCISFLDELYNFIAIEAYNASISLSAEKGSFPEYDRDKYMQGHYIQERLPESSKKLLRAHGIRNVTLLTQAPTGTTGTMVNTSTGIEPFYFWEWERKGRMGTYTERVRIYDDYIKQYGANLPAHFVTAQDLKPEEHIRVQAIVQKWIDNAISKTCNVPEDYTVEQVGELYKLMYELGCKGGTVYRNNSRTEQVLNLKDESPELHWRNRPDHLNGSTLRKETPVGTLYVTINSRKDGPFEVFLTIGKAGSELMAEAEALGRLISYILRMPSTQSPQERIQTIIGQLNHIGSGRSLGFGVNRVSSLADAIAKVLAEFIGIDEDETSGLPEDEVESKPIVLADICPNCGQASFYRIEGCKKCNSCEYSEC